MPDCFAAFIIFSQQHDDSAACQSAAPERLTAVQAGLHKHTDGSHTQLKVVRGDVSGVPHDEGQRLHALDEGLGVMLAQVLTHRQTVLVHQTVGLLGLEAEGGAFICLQLLFPNLEEDRSDRSAGRRQNRSPLLPSKTPPKHQALPETDNKMHRSYHCVMKL